MATLAEMIAARKAATANQTPAPKPEVVAKPTGDGFTDAMEELAEKAATAIIKGTIATVEPEIKAEPVLAEPKKVLSFAEVLAQKKAAASRVVVASSDAAPATARVFDLPQTIEAEEKKIVEKRVVAVPPKALAPTFMQKLIPAAATQADAEDLAREEYLNAPTDVQDGYRDIKHKVYALAEYDDSALEEPMSQLKKALLANPNACLLMLDEDIGKMTIALRRLVQESLVEVVKEKKVPKDKKTLNAPLSAEQLQKVFDEL